jgi:hypothetical protein
VILIALNITKAQKIAFDFSIEQNWIKKASQIFIEKLII